jgi:hypothetical protein
MDMNRKQLNAVARIESRLQSYDPNKVLHPQGIQFKYEYNPEYEYLFCSLLNAENSKWHESRVFTCFTIGKRGGIKILNTDNKWLARWIKN